MNEIAMSYVHCKPMSDSANAICMVERLIALSNESHL